MSVLHTANTGNKVFKNILAEFLQWLLIKMYVLEKHFLRSILEWQKWFLISRIFVQVKKKEQLYTMPELLHKLSFYFERLHYKHCSKKNFTDDCSVSMFM